MTSKHISTIDKLIHEAEETGLLKECQDLSGYSGLKLIGTLQRIAAFQESNGAGDYLEVGVFQGLTLVSVAACLSEMKAFGIDNFSQFDSDGSNQRTVAKRVSANQLQNIDLINLDYEDALENLSEHIGDRKIGTYFVDGPHDYRSQLMCLLLAKPFLSKGAVIIVDDSNYRHVRLANRDFLIANPEYKLLFESYTRCHPGNMTEKEIADARQGWWNGVNIIVHDPENEWTDMFPGTHRSRMLFENDHLIHASRYAEIAPEIVAFTQSVFSFRLLRGVKNMVKIFRKRRSIEGGIGGRYLSANTYSEKLPRSHFNSKRIGLLNNEEASA